MKRMLSILNVSLFVLFPIATLFFILLWQNVWMDLIYTTLKLLDKEMWFIYIVEYYSAIKKNEMAPFAAALMDLENVILTEVSQTEVEILYNIPYV